KDTGRSAADDYYSGRGSDLADFGSSHHSRQLKVRFRGESAPEAFRIGDSEFHSVNVSDPGFLAGIYALAQYPEIREIAFAEKKAFGNTKLKVGFILIKKEVVVTEKKTGFIRRHGRSLRRVSEAAVL